SPHSTHLPRTPFFLYLHPPLRHLLSFPTRRSSDLTATVYSSYSFVPLSTASPLSVTGLIKNLLIHFINYSPSKILPFIYNLIKRSEEHTSALESRFDLVCSLLLELKKRCAPSVTRV